MKSEACRGTLEILLDVRVSVCEMDYKERRRGKFVA